MNNLNNQEEAFRSVLQDMNFEIDASKIWTDIKDQLPIADKKERKPFWMYFFGLSGILFLSSFALFVVINDAQDLQPKGISFLTTDANLSIPIHQNNISNSIINPSNTKTTLLKSDINKSLFNTTNPSQLLSPISSVDNDFVNSDLTDNTKSFTLQSNLSIDTNSKRKSSNEKSVQSLSSGSLFDNSKLTNDKQQQETSGLRFQNTEMNPIFTINRFNHLYDSDSNKIPMYLEYDLNIHPIIQEVNKFGIFFSINSGVNYGLSSNFLSVINSEFDENEFSKESGRVGLSTDFNVGIESRNGWRFFGSLAYDYDVFNYTNNETVISQDVETGTTSIHINSLGQAIPMTGNIEVTRTTAFNLSHHRRHHDIAVGIGVAKRLSVYERLSIVPQVRALYNIHRNSSGYFFDESSNAITKFDSSASNPYRTNNFLKYNLGIGIDYSIGKMSFGLISSYTYNPNNYIDDNFFYGSTSDRVDLKLSISYYPQW